MIKKQEFKPEDFIKFQKVSVFITGGSKETVRKNNTSHRAEVDNLLNRVQDWMNEIKHSFKDGDNVYSFDHSGKKQYGIIHKNIDFPEISEWYIKYDDGEECAVLDLNLVFYK